MAERQRREGLDISAFFGFLRRRGLIIVLTAIVAGVAGYLISSSKTDEYTAHATLLLRGPISSQTQDDFTPSVPDASQDREALITADPVRARAEVKLRGITSRSDAKSLVDDANVTSGENSGALQISVTAKTARAAAAGANAMAQAAIDERKAQTLARTRRAISAAQRAQRGTPANSPAAVTIEQRLTDLRQAAATADGGADITARATVPSAPTSPKPKRDALIGAFAGLLLGFVLAMVREQLDRRVKHSRELEDLFELPVLANIPRSRAIGRAEGRALEPLPPGEAESFQMLRANLRFLQTDRELRSVVVTSPGVGDGKSTISINLAKADASVGKRVLLIEADMRRPKLGSLLGIGDAPGLAAYLADPNLELVDVARRLPVANRGNGNTQALTMDVIVSGTAPSNPAELVNSDRMFELVREAERDYDLVVIDTSPAGLVADAIPLMSQATAVVIVGRVGRITSSEADNLREQLQRIDAPTFGLVANFTGSDQGYGYY